LAFSLHLIGLFVSEGGSLAVEREQVIPGARSI